MPRETIVWSEQEANGYFEDPRRYGHLLNALTDPDRPTRFIGGVHQEFLRDLQRNTRQQFDRAIIIIDNSGSTGAVDGKVYHGMDWGTGRFNRRSTTRLNEICQRAIDSLILYRTLGLPCIVTALNQEAFRDDGRGRQVSAGRLPSADVRFDGSERSFQECIGYILSIRRLFARCSCVTPLTSTLERVMPGDHPDQIGIILNIITDGLPNEGNRRPQEEENRQLAELINKRGLNLKKMNIVLNLATDEQAVVDYYGDLVDGLGQDVDASRKDMQIQKGRINADTIDDFWSELLEVTGKNAFFSYPLMLHFIRQAGLVAHTQMDLLDERQLKQRERFRLALELLAPEQLSLALLPKIIAGIPLVYQPQKELNHAKEIYYDDEGGRFKPLIDPRALVKAVIAQEKSFVSRQVLKLRLKALNHFLPSPQDMLQEQQQQALGVQALELPGREAAGEEEGDGLHGPRRGMGLRLVKGEVVVEDDELDNGPGTGDAPPPYSAYGQQGDYRPSAPPM